MEEADTIKFVKICRFCLSQDEEYLIPIARAPDIAITIQDVARFTGLDINETNKTMYAMCLECMENLKGAAAFRKKCQGNDAIFHELYAAMASSVDEIYSEMVEYLDSNFLEGEQDPSNKQDRSKETVEIIELDDMVEEVEPLENSKEDEKAENPDHDKEVDKTIENLEKDNWDEEEDAEGLCLVALDDCMIKLDLRNVLETSNNGSRSIGPRKKYRHRVQTYSSLLEQSSSQAQGTVWQQLNCLLQQSSLPVLESSSLQQESISLTQGSSSFRPESKSLWQQLSSVLKPSSVPSQESSSLSKNSTPCMQKSSSLTQESSSFSSESKTLGQQLSSVSQPPSLPSPESSLPLKNTSPRLPESSSLTQESSSFSSVVKPIRSKLQLNRNDDVIIDENPFSYCANYIDIGEPLESDDSSGECSDRQGHNKRNKKRKADKEHKQDKRRKRNILGDIVDDIVQGPVYPPNLEEPKVGVWKITSSCKRRLHLCEMCGIYVIDLTTHIKSHAPEPDISCTLCSKMFRRLFSLKSHIKQVHAKEVCKTCNICGKGFVHHKTYRYHMLDHASEGKRFECEPCGASFTNHIYLRDHFNRKHNISRTK